MQRYFISSQFLSGEIPETRAAAAAVPQVCPSAPLFKREAVL
ncbi:hypothetical protein [Paenibacillus sp. S150]|nr:hypothetical protein [Paenibacillus sp. S150]